MKKLPDEIGASTDLESEELEHDEDFLNDFFEEEE